ncbi:hypothetical protein H6G41_16035 [Tolypothrix sp. FACHB-123]|uniref:hypothetical protein n=1 Tax=Tolypothrix sp. FACHB-123 TaxID=2692868 RepID=UPI00168880F1|nr:hypothetical protein [Tolypothrix sp. FACHB-123]MBD2356115.1 hypothetical protein [Tolypothrix sp. FACHB-123]
MTSHTDEIQKLIADIDNLLASNGKRLSKLLSGQSQEPREVLERTRDFLGRLAETTTLAADEPNKPAEQKTLSPLLAKFVEHNHQSVSENQQAEQEQITTAISALIQPIKAELAGLLQERAALVQEIRQLEQRRLQSHSLSQQLANQEQIINEFLQVLGNRLLPSLTAQLTQGVTNSPVTVNPGGISETSPQGERLSKLAKDLDQRLLSLDGTVNVVFEALQRNILTYHESLSQALARMHNQGLQGEQVMVGFVNNLTQYIQQFPGDRPALSISQTSSDSVDHQTPIQPQPEAPDPTTEDLDTVLSQLIADATPPTPQTQAAIPNTFLVDSSPADEVDQLYASLFSRENIPNSLRAVSPPPVVADAVTAEEDTSGADLLDLSVTDTPAADTVLETAATLPIPEPPIQQTEPSPEWQDLFFDEATETTSSPPEVVTVPEAQANQSGIYTITALTELLGDGDTEILPALESVNEVIKTTTFTPKTAKPEVVILDEEQNQSFDNYIPASAQENLLEPEVTPTMPEITLDEEQLQLLDEDLAQFDGLLNSPSKLITSWVNSNNQNHQEQLQKESTTNNELPQMAAGAAPQTEPELHFSPIIEKKKQETTADAASPSLSVAHSGNQPEVSLTNNQESRWYLGIDLGTTGISAALLNSSTFVVYPIYWLAENQAGASAFQQSFRLPAEVYLPTASVNQGEGENAPASDLIKTSYSAQLKPYLQLAIPYKSARQKWEPVLQFNEFSAGPLVWVVRSLSKLLLTLKSDRQSTTQGLAAAAVGLDEQSFRNIINNLAGAICTCPASWSEQYRFNVREALLTSKLVQHPQQVFFVEEAIASLLSLLNASNGETVQLSSNQGLRPIQINEQPLLGNTLALNIGATATEMALVDLAENFQELTHNDFMLHSFAYGGKSIEQDIICQLLVPPKSRQSRSEIVGEQISSQPGLWRSNIPGLDYMHWQSLGLEELELPRVGEPDISARVRLQQRLESSLLGQAVLDAALALKLILQHQESFTLDLADQRWVLQRRDLESQILVPFVRRLNRELNKLLVARGIPTEAINQAILTGGVASIGTINRWLKQKLPNAKIMQDAYLGENGAPNCSRVAYGLAMLPLHPQVLELARQQYTDYFLFTELLRLLPERALSFNEVIQLFEGRGVNTRTCQQRLLAFLEGELPAGLIPNGVDINWLTQSSQENPDYHAIASAPLFEKQGNLTYRPNSQQLLALRRYLDAIKASTRQSLEEPYTLNFSLEVAH